MTDITYTHEINNLDNNNLSSCKKCNMPIYEGHAYELGDDRWHINCFKCSKCESSLGCNSNFLVLGNGSLICSNCSYNCKQCHKKIDDLAILTGDQAYCSNCFKCRSCKLKIEDLRYARTSKGLFCMNCHEKLVAKKKKYDAKKKQLALLQQKEGKEKDVVSGNTSLQRNSVINNNYNSVFNNSNRSSLSVSAKDKLLPPPPPKSSSSIQQLNQQPLIVSNSHLVSRESFHSIKTDNSIPSLGTPQLSSGTSDTMNDKTIVQDNDFSIEEINDSDDELNKRAKQQLPENSSHRWQQQTSTPPLTSENDQEVSEKSKIDNGSIFLDIINTTAIPNSKDKLQPAVVITPKRHRQGSQEGLEVSSGSRFKDKNLLILSPNQFHDNEFHNTSAISPVSSPNPNNISTSSNDIRTTILLAPTDEHKARSACPSPFARVNRQARVVETNDYISTDNLEDEMDTNLESNVVNTPKEKMNDNNYNTSSPPPKLPLPAVPSTPNKKSFGTPTSTDSKKFKNDDGTPKGLGLEGVDYNENNNPKNNSLKKQRNAEVTSQQTSQLRIIGNATPSVTKLEETVDQSSSISRKNTLIRTPKISLKHKRSISGGSGGIAGKFGLFKSNNNNTSSKHENSLSIKGHSRHVSDGSINGSSAFTTPPLPMASSTTHTSIFNNGLGFNKEHIRSSSDTPFITNIEPHNDGIFDIKLLKSELNQLDNQKFSLDKEIKKLTSDKLRLNDQLKSIQMKTSNESKVLENLLKEIENLEKDKKKLLEINQALSEQNHQLEFSIKQNSNNAFETELANNSSSIHKSDSTTLANSTTNTMISNNTSNSSTSLVAGNPYSEFSANDESNGETHKATRLKFWRRPKIGFNSPNLIQPNQPLQTQQQSPQSQYQQQSQSNNSSKMSQSYSSYSIHSQIHNDNSLNVDKKSVGSFITKSRSTNLLDTFLTNSNSNNSTNDSSNYENNSAPLFTSTIQKRADYENERVPLIITKCIAEVEKRGLDVEGIYRISGGNSAIVAIENAFANLSPNPASDEKQMSKLEDTISGDINAVTSALKRYLRKLPDPLIPYSLYDDFIKVSSTNPPNKIDKRIIDLKIKVITELPSANKQTLYLLCKHLALVSSYSGINRMGFKNLSVVFAPTIARDETGEKEMIDMGYRNDVTELLLNNHEKIFY